MNGEKPAIVRCTRVCYKGWWAEQSLSLGTVMGCRAISIKLLSLLLLLTPTLSERPFLTSQQSILHTGGVFSLSTVDSTPSHGEHLDHLDSTPQHGEHLGHLDNTPSHGKHLASTSDSLICTLQGHRPALTLAEDVADTNLALTRI